MSDDGADGVAGAKEGPAEKPDVNGGSAGTARNLKSTKSRDGGEGRDAEESAVDERRIDQVRGGNDGVKRVRTRVGGGEGGGDDACGPGKYRRTCGGGGGTTMMRATKRRRKRTTTKSSCSILGISSRGWKRSES